MPFGVFVTIGDGIVQGIVQITDFVDSEDMTPEIYPDAGAPIGSVVVGLYRKRAQSSLIKCEAQCVGKALVHLKAPETSERS